MLWTPNPKTIEPVHLCPVCGGIDRKHHPAATRDARRFLSLHRICCCGESYDCNDLCVDVTVSGVDTALCTNCVAVADGFGGYNSFHWSSSAVDGNYNDLAASGSSWTASYSFSNPNYMCAAETFGNQTCAGTPAQTINYEGTLSVSGTCTTSSITITQVLIDPGGTAPFTGVAVVQFSWSGSESNGATVNNQLSCDTTNGANVCDGGTVTVSVSTCPP